MSNNEFPGFSKQIDTEKINEKYVLKTNAFEGLSSEEKEIFKNLITIQLLKGIKIKIKYLEYDSETKTLTEI